MNHIEFLKICSEIHKNKFDYSESIFVNMGTKLKVICNTCNTIWQVRPLHHIGKSKSGCPTCANASRRLHKNKTTEEFILQSTITHCGKYDYSKVIYEKNHLKVKIICPHHGIFEQSPSTHLKGIGCKICSGYKSTIKQEKEYRMYKGRVWSITNKSYRKFKNIINPLDLPRSRVIHLDHKFSISDGFKNGILPEIMGHYTNLQMLQSHENRKKWNNSSITLEQLISSFNFSVVNP